jgi:hypothetical protein
LVSITEVVVLRELKKKEEQELRLLQDQHLLKIISLHLG